MIHVVLFVVWWDVLKILDKPNWEIISAKSFISLLSLVVLSSCVTMVWKSSISVQGFRCDLNFRDMTFTNVGVFVLEHKCSDVRHYLDALFFWWIHLFFQREPMQIIKLMSTKNMFPCYYGFSPCSKWLPWLFFILEIRSVNFPFVLPSPIPLIYLCLICVLWIQFY